MSNSVQTRKRIEWLDGLRAFAMVAVVLVHSSFEAKGWWTFNVFIGPIMLPLFFAISGYLFQSREENSKTFFIKLFKKLIVPLIFLSMIWIRLLLIPFRGTDYFIHHFINFITGKDLWYINACIIAEIIFFYIRTIFPKPWKTSCAAIILAIAGFLLTKTNIGDYILIDRALIAQSFLLTGFLFRTYEQQITRNIQYAFGNLVIYIALGVTLAFLLPGTNIDIYMNTYPSVPLCFLMIFIGNITLFALCSRFIKAVPTWIKFIGQNTLVIYGLHGLVLAYFSPTNWIQAFGTATAVTLICCIAAILLNRIIPQAVGKNKIKR